MHKTDVAIARGDGIGPEIMDAVLFILQEGGAPLTFVEVQVGEQVYRAGHTTGLTPDVWEVLKSTKAFLKAPITTPQGGGFKSINVTIRAHLGLYANVRPCVAYHPFVRTKHPDMDVVVVRENEEDLYAGIEHQQTPDVMQALKLISRSGCERIIRYAFDYAKQYERKKVTCFTKDNILKLSDGLFHEVFDEIAKEYPNIENEHWIVDIGAAKLADTPNVFDVVVMPNLYGDILSDVSAQIAGSVGLAGSANIGVHGAMFEAIHGSAPRRANQDLANPSGLLLAAIAMLVHLGYPKEAETIHNAWLKTIEEGIHTYDIYNEGISKKKVGTKAFARAVVERLGQQPSTLKTAHYRKNPQAWEKSSAEAPTTKQELEGIDVFLRWEGTGEELQKKVHSLTPKDLSLDMITNRGARIWPEGQAETTLVDQWRCRFLAKGTLTQKESFALLLALDTGGLTITQAIHLYRFDGKSSYSGANLKK